MIENFFTSRVRVGIVNLFLERFGESYHVRDISRKVGSEVNAVRRELDNLVKVKFLSSQPKGNRLYFQVNPDFLLLEELSGMVAKTTGVGQLILDRREDLGDIKYAALSKHFLRGRESAEKEVDLLVVGNVNTGGLENVLEEFEKNSERHINCAVLSEKDFNLRKSRHDRFVTDILLDPRVMLVGDEVEFYG